MGLHQLVQGTALTLPTVAVGKLKGETSAPNALHPGQLLFDSRVLFVCRSMGSGKEQYRHAERQYLYPHELSS
jgi:hypothetical protein